MRTDKDFTSEKAAELLSLPTLVLLFHGLPFILFGVFAAYWQRSGSSWKILTLSFLLSCLGSLTLIALFRLRENALLEASPTPREEKAPFKADRELVTGNFSENFPDNSSDHSLDNSLDKSSASFQKKAPSSFDEDQLHTLSEQSRDKDRQIAHLKEMKQQLLQELERSKKHEEQERQSAEQRLLADEKKIYDLETALEDMTMSLEKKQQLIAKLENKVRDLNYEVKTLLQIGDIQEEGKGTQEPSPLSLLLPEKEGQEQTLSPETLSPSFDKKALSPYDASLQLEKCISTAKRLSGANHLGGKRARFLDLAIDSNVIDLRRLFDSFRNENSMAIIVYAPKDERVLFANHIVKDLLGWSTERFSKDFFQLIQEGSDDFRRAIKKLEPNEETLVHISLKGRDGDTYRVRCHLGLVPSGVFVNHVIGVFLPV
ncbi:MAG: conserved putative rane protein [Chlamydiales bacterium]|jgi:PAS domain-containing protein|nr:conserved putative rane protein [Chlamydiales bacterium]